MARKKKQEQQKELGLKDFVYVYFQFTNPKTGFTSKWERVHVDDLVRRAEAHAKYNVFASIQRYAQPVDLKSTDPELADKELVVTPIFFDIDNSRTLAPAVDEDGIVPDTSLIEIEKVHSSELEGLMPVYLVDLVRKYEKGIDLTPEECKSLNAYVDRSKELKELVWAKNLELSRHDAVQIVTYFKQRFNLRDEHIRVWFSGSKGFHIVIHETVAGITPKPAEDMKGIIKLVALELNGLLDLKGLDVKAIGSIKRLLRLPNSRHQSSGLWKVELTHEELLADDIVATIKSIAQAPRQSKAFPTLEEVYEPNEELVKWMAEIEKLWEESKKHHTTEPVITDEALAKMEGYPVCVQFLLDNGILRADTRNQATVALACYFKDAKVPLEEAERILVEWAKKLPRGLVSSPPKKVVEDTKRVVRFVYDDPKYHFSCGAILSLHGEERDGKKKLIPCARKKCPIHTEYHPDEEPMTMHLAKTADAKLSGKKVATDVLVSGKLETPYIVPKRVQYTCAHQQFCDKPCIMHEFNGAMEIEFDESDRILIETTAQSDTQIRGALRAYIKPGCNKVVPRVEEEINVTEILVVPMAERVDVFKHEKTPDGGELLGADSEGNEFVTRKIYTTDYTIKANQYYRIEGYVYSHPRNAQATMLVSKATPKEDNIEQFKLTPEIKEQFKVFQVPENSNMDDHIDFIIQDLANNVTRVYARDEAHLALLLNYHSCLSYDFQGQREKRGWTEMIFVGDSGQAKTQLVSRIMDFVNLGNSVNAEAASRTGLSYRIEEFNGRHFISWGKFPLSDRKMLVIDEFSELSKDDFGKLTKARTDGILQVDRVVSAETNARVRLLLLTNPAFGRTLSDFTYPVESLRKLFDSPADIRRLDLAVFFRSGDVPEDVLFTKHSKADQNRIPAEVLRNSILWAWSRKPEQIVIDDVTEEVILQQAKALANKYGFAKTIPLCEPSDLSKKVARLSIALAALLHSTDENHELVIVKPEHVEYVTAFMDALYSADNCRFDKYNDAQYAESMLTAEEKEKITERLKQADEKDMLPVSEDLLRLLRRNEVLKVQEIIDMLGYTREQVVKRVKILNDFAMVKRTRDGLQKLPKLIAYLNQIDIK